MIQLPLGPDRLYSIYSPGKMPDHITKAFPNADGVFLIEVKSKKEAHRIVDALENAWRRHEGYKSTT